MAHERKRHVRDLYAQLLSFSPITGVFGHRQVGKSTFLAASAGEYRTLDDDDVLEQAQTNPKVFINSHKEKSLIIDECQLAPKLFPALKECVRKNKRPGQFILSGSVRFTSRIAIRESLAGRMAFFEMFPFSVSEICGESLTETVPLLLRHKKFTPESLRALRIKQERRKISKHFETYLKNGGLPGLCFIRNPQLQRTALNDLHNLILSRDLVTVSGVKTSIYALKKMLTYIAKNGLEPYYASEVTKSLRLAAATQKNILNAFESMFLIRRIPIMNSKRECLVLEDQLEERVYCGQEIDDLKQLESAVYRNIRTQFFYRLDKETHFQSYLTRDNARIPLVIESQGDLLGICIFKGNHPTLSQKRSGASFLQNFANSKLLYLSDQEIEPEILSDRILYCSISAVI